MRLTRFFRSTITWVVLAIPVVGMMAISAAPKPAAEKPNPFPLSLFGQAKASDYIDESQCMECHDQKHADNPMARAYASFQASPHKPFVETPGLAPDKKGCQACHGPGKPHVDQIGSDDALQYIFSYNNATPKEVALACLRCHNDVMTENHWERTDHARGNISCISCHKIHQDGHPDPLKATGKGPKGPVFPSAAEPRKLLKADQATLCGSCHRLQANRFRMNFHHPVPEGRMVCSDCHQVHPQSAGAKGDSDPRSPTQVATIGLQNDKETCVTCHAENAGPFVYQHDPVEGMTGQGCLECHNPHGSQNPFMLNLSSRGLCAQCHADKLTTHNPGRTCWSVGCHVGIHGSDHDRNLLAR